MPVHTPYKDAAVNQIYNLMFCDAPELFGQWNTGEAAPVFAQPLNERAVRAIADDRNIESRVRALAFNRLKREGRTVPKGVLLGVVVEAALDRGLDTMAAYADGRVRYINASEKMIILEQDPQALRDAREDLLNASREVLNELQPTAQPRPGPPPRDQTRLSFIVSDGLYVGQAEISALAEDYLGGPILKAANRLLNAAIAFASENSR
ncbi:MAG: hypothetical protein QM759_03525 [Terricaulis sp.]